ncbi:hypothetical protein Hanom_Chr10g00874781 [Helianthus anomalus]
MVATQVVMSPIVPSAVSELFGLKSFCALYNFLTLATPTGSLIFFVIASGIYDYETKIQSATNLNMLTNGKALTCYGTICYSITCGILSVLCLCLMAFVLSMIVLYRTKRVYAKLYGSS